MNKQITSAEIERFTDACGCGLARTNRRSAMSVKERFTGLDKFDTLLGPNEKTISRPCTGIGAWATPVTRQNLPIPEKATLVKVESGPCHRMVSIYKSDARSPGTPSRGGVAGWLAEQFMKSDMGLIMNIVLGIVGAAIAFVDGMAAAFNSPPSRWKRWRGRRSLTWQR